jgi:hypothetical protein
VDRTSPRKSASTPPASASACERTLRNGPHHTRNSHPGAETILATYLVLKTDDKLGIFESGLAAKVAEDGSVQGSTTLHFNRFDFVGTETYTTASRALTDGTAISGTPVALSAAQKTLNVQELAGPYNGTAVAPIGITEGMLKMSMHSLAERIGPALMRDYKRFRDAVVRDLALASTVYVTGGATPSLTNEGAIAAAQAATYAWLTEVRQQLADRKVPPFANERYRGFIQPRHTKELLRDADVKAAMNTRPDAAQIVGYIGTLAGIDLYEWTFIPTKGVGAGGAVVGYQSIFFGGIPGVGLYQHEAVSVRVKDDTDYGRQLNTVWKEFAGYADAWASDVIVRGITT